MHKFNKEQVCGVCGTNAGTLGHKSNLRCTECDNRIRQENMYNKRIRDKMENPEYCECCGKRVYGEFSKGMCDFCNTEYTGMMQEQQFRRMNKHDVFKSILKVKKKLDEMDVLGMNIQDIRI